MSRSIKDKSVLFDNSLKELKDQISEVQYRSEQELRTLTQDMNRIQSRDQGSTHITGMVQQLDFSSQKV
jgi:hypothetical protein